MNPPSPCLGSQLFVNRETTPEEVRDLVRLMAENGLSLIRLFVIWDQVEPRPGVWNFDTYDAVFDTAGEFGLGVVPTLMSVSPPGWMLRTGGVQSVACLEDPGVLAAGEKYIRALVSRWASHPALHSWILWNEASRLLPRTPATLERHRVFLSEKFRGDPGKMNEICFQTHASFEDVGKEFDGESVELEFKGFAEKILWQEFAVEELCHHLRRIASIVREHDALHPVHVNPHGLATYTQHAGQSVWREAHTVDFLGCSSHPVWHSTRFGRDRWTRSVGLFADLVRSATPANDGTFWVTELQGGTTLLSAGSSDCPSPAEVEHWLWEGIGAGAKASVFWCFNWRSSGFEAGEWHLLDLDGQPGPRLDAVRRVDQALKENRHWFENTRPSPPGALILRSDANERLSWVSGLGGDAPNNPRNPNRALDSASGAALWLADLGVETGHVEESLLEATLLDPNRCPPLIVAPGLEALCEGTLALLARFVENGGHLVADGPLGWKDPYGRLAPHRQPLWKKLFGAPLADVTAWRNAEAVPDDADEPVPWWLEVILRTAGPSPMVHTHSQGRGTTHLVRTWCFHRFLLSDYPKTREGLARLVPEGAYPPVRLTEPGPGRRLRLLHIRMGLRES